MKLVVTNCKGVDSHNLDFYRRYTEVVWDGHGALKPKSEIFDFEEDPEEAIERILRIFEGRLRMFASGGKFYGTDEISSVRSPGMVKSILSWLTSPP
jgi:hypothetical protein